MTRLFLLLLTLLFSLSGPVMGEYSDFGGWSNAAKTAQTVASRLEVGVHEWGITKVFDPASATHIAGEVTRPGVLMVENIVVDASLRGQGVSVELYKRLIAESGGDAIKMVRGIPGDVNLSALTNFGIAATPRARALSKLGFTDHRLVNGVMISSRP